MGCNYLLTNVKMDRHSRHYMLFPSEQERNATIIGDNSFSDFEINFNFGNRLNASCVVNDYNNQNYMVINQYGYYHFYFIDSSQYMSANQWRLNLTLDVITTYLPGNNNVFTECLIRRAHVNRFVYTDNSRSRIKFDVRSGSPIIKSESKMALVNKTRRKVRQKYCENSIINNWLNDNVLCWCYVYVDQRHNYRCMGNMVGSVIPRDYEYRFRPSMHTIGMTTIDDEYATLCVPIYKTTCKIGMKDSLYKIFTYIEGLDLFRDDEDNNSFIYNIKYSMRPPVNFESINPNNVGIDLEGNLILNYSTIGFDIWRQGWSIGNGVIDVMSFYGTDEIIIDNTVYCKRLASLFVNVVHIGSICEDINTDYQYEFDVNQLNGSRKIGLEPKLMLDCCSIVLRDSSNGEYSYNPLLLNDNRLHLEYSEPNNITNTNYYYRLFPTGLVSENDDKNWSGIVNTVDYSQQTVNDNYADFIANNKNFLLTKQMQIVPSLLTNVVTGNVAGLADSGMDVIGMLTEIDNIKNKVSSLNNSNDAVQLNMMVNEGLNIYVDIDEAYDFEKIMYYNYLFKNGYKLDIIDNPYYYISSRFYFNYIQCELEHVNINLPSILINEIKNIFRNGVTLWHQYGSMYRYDMENKEINIGVG